MTFKLAPKYFGFKTANHRSEGNSDAPMAPIFQTSQPVSETYLKYSSRFFGGKQRYMKKQSFGYCLLAGLMLASLGLLAKQPITSPLAPFDTESSPSEQLRFNGSSPQIVGTAIANSLTFSWQLYEGNNPTSSKITHFTRAAGNYTKAWEKLLPLPRLVGMCSDGSNFYVVSAAREDLSADKNTLQFRPNVLIMTKLDAQGNQLWQRDLNNAEYLGNNPSSAVFSPMTAGTGALSYGAGKVIVALASNTVPDPQGFRHQRAQYFVVGADGGGFRAASETSWRHSFDQRLVFDGQDFIFTDLADAGWYMPGGGITVRKIRPTSSGADFIGDQENKQGTYIYARQAETENNQNFAFTSLGDLEIGAQGYLALFTSEKSNPGRTRNGWIEPVMEPRNLGFVHVTRAFETVREGSWNGGETRGNTIIQNSDPIKINITRSVVDSSGLSQTFQRPANPNKTFTQTGIVWLTNLSAGMSAERPKMIKLAPDRFVALWEEWSYSGAQLTHNATKGMLFNEQGQILAGPLSFNARLNPSGADRPFVLDGKVAWIVGNAASGKFTLFTVDTNLALSKVLLDQNGIPQPIIWHDHLSANDTLKPGDKLQSNNGLYRLLYQTDGNLALYATGGRFLWASGTAGQAAGYAIMQTDGNFAIYGPDSRFQWNTGTTTAGSRLVLRDDGNLVILTREGAQIWASNTAQVRDRLNAGDTLRPGDKLQSSNGRYTLLYQTDGNLGLYTAEGRFLWASGTAGHPAGYLRMQTDGNFAMYGPDNRFQWNTGTTTPGSWIVLQSDGNLVVYTPANIPIWASNTTPN